jgi:alpha-1,3-rhamnosyltransferase
LPKRDRKRDFRRLDFEDVLIPNKPCAPVPTLLFLSEALEDVGGFDTKIRLEDLLIALKITHAGYFIDVLPDVLAKYRVHGSSTHKNRRFMIDNVLKTYALFEDHPDYPKVCARFINSMQLKCARRGKPLARELLGQILLRYWNRKSLRVIGRYMLK